MVVIRTARLRLLWRKQLRDAVPTLIRELKVTHFELVDAGRPERWCLLPGSSSAMTYLGNRLVTAAKGRPAKLEGEALRRLSDSQKQPTDLRHGQREEIGTPPFSSILA